MTSKIVQLFEKVQKIPYKVCFFSRESINPNILYGDCRHKSELLHTLLVEEGYEVKKIKVEFDWKDLPLPKNIISILKRSGTIFSHDSLMVKINHKWIKVDCTWNPELEKKGFPITKNWDGQSNTKQVTEGKLKFYDTKTYTIDMKIVKVEVLKFAEQLNKYLSS